MAKPTERDREKAQHLFNAVRASTPGGEASKKALEDIAECLAAARMSGSARPRGMGESELTPFEFELYVMAFTTTQAQFQKRKEWAAESVLQWRHGGPTKAVGFGDLADALFATATRMAWARDRGPSRFTHFGRER